MQGYKNSTFSSLTEKFFNFKGGTSSMLTIAYIGALFLIALFTYGSHMVTAHIMERQKESTEVSYHLGRQRGLVQQISYHAFNYFHHDQEVDHTLLVNSINDMKESQKFLKNTMFEMGFLDSLLGRVATSSALYKIYFEQPYYLERQITVFLDKATDFSAFDQYDKKEEREKALGYVSEQFTNHLMPGLDAALSGYQKESIDKINQYYQLQMMAMIFIMLVLTLEALFIFRPLVTRIKKYHLMLRRQALEDELTGLNNRRAFMVQSKKALVEAVENARPITFALMDLDKFKAVNDTYGHDVGDRVIQHFSRILETSIRPQDIVGRVGGEEFAMVLTETDQGGALKILERIREKTEKTPCRYKDENGQNAGLDYTSSIGFIALKPGKNNSVDELLKKADEALYESKEGGRNRVSSAAGLPAGSQGSKEEDAEVTDTALTETHASSKT